MCTRHPSFFRDDRPLTIPTISLFSTGSHSRWLTAFYDGERKFPQTQIYAIGNPIIAQSMLAENPNVGLNVPPQLLVVALEDGKGTYIVYDLPSSVIASGKGSPELREVALDLDDKFEKLVRKALE